MDDDALKINHYGPLRRNITQYLRFGDNGEKTIKDLKKAFYSLKLPDTLGPAQVPGWAAKIAQLHAQASYELSLAECALELATEMYDYALIKEIETINSKYKTRSPGADKLRMLALENLDKNLTLQKLYARNALTMMKRVITHLDYLASRLKNAVEALKIDARLEKGML